MTTNLLTHCGVCSQAFTKQDFPKLSDSLVFTVCFHIFHKTCLGGWVNTSEKNCPICRSTIYRHQGGKDYSVYINCFLKALKKDPDIVLNVIENSEHNNQKCIAYCQEKLPFIPLLYDDRKKQFVHPKCSSSKSMPKLLMQDLADIVKKRVEKYPDLQKQFTPTPPTFYQRFTTDYPLLSRIMLIGSISMSALVLNKHTFSGGNWLLSAIGLPAYLTLIAAQQVGFSIIALLNNPNA